MKNLIKEVKATKESLFTAIKALGLSDISSLEELVMSDVVNVEALTFANKLKELIIAEDIKVKRARLVKVMNELDDFKVKANNLVKECETLNVDDKIDSLVADMMESILVMTDEQFAKLNLEGSTKENFVSENLAMIDKIQSLKETSFFKYASLSLQNKLLTGDDPEKSVRYYILCNSEIVGSQLLSLSKEIAESLDEEKAKIQKLKEAQTKTVEKSSETSEKNEDSKEVKTESVEKKLAKNIINNDSIDEKKLAKELSKEKVKTKHERNIAISEKRHLENKAFLSNMTAAYLGK